jgi:hypothetical protein
MPDSSRKTSLSVGIRRMRLRNFRRFTSTSGRSHSSGRRRFF